MDVFPLIIQWFESFTHAFVQVGDAISVQYGAWMMFASAFLAATVLPFPSEATFTALHTHWPEHAWLWWGVATLGNTLGALSMFALAWHFSHRVPAQQLERGVPWLARVGPWAPALLVMSWMPVVGDVLVLAGGYLKLPVLPSVAFIALGKALRYAALAGVLQLF